MEHLSFGLILACLLGYFLPWVVAASRDCVHRHRDGIALLNVLLGWTGIGWIVALIWAAAAPSRRERTAA